MWQEYEEAAKVLLNELEKPEFEVRVPARRGRLLGNRSCFRLWLLTVSMESLFSGHHGTLIPAATGSTLLLAVNAGLRRYALRFDRDTQAH
jgi:hypothetical protein